LTESDRDKYISKIYIHFRIKITSISLRDVYLHRWAKNYLYYLY